MVYWSGLAQKFYLYGDNGNGPSPADSQSVEYERTVQCVKREVKKCRKNPHKIIKV